MPCLFVSKDDSCSTTVPAVSTGHGVGLEHRGTCELEYHATVWQHRTWRRRGMGTYDNATTGCQ
eukprot:3941262-Rhodomonas_salina.5